MIYHIILLFVITQITFHTFRKKKTTWNWHLSLSAFLFFSFALWFFTAVFWSVPDQSGVFSSFQRMTERPRMNTGFQINFSILMCISAFLRATWHFLFKFFRHSDQTQPPQNRINIGNSPNITKCFRPPDNFCCLLAVFKS